MNENKEAGRTKKNEKQMNFEEAMSRLEKIVEEMESGKMDLESMISRFEEGQRLIKFCSAKLNEVEKRVEVLVKKGGELTKEPFDESEAGDENEEPSGGKKGESVPF